MRGSHLSRRRGETRTVNETMRCREGKKARNHNHAGVASRGLDNWITRRMVSTGDRRETLATVRMGEVEDPDVLDHAKLPGATDEAEICSGCASGNPSSKIGHGEPDSGCWAPMRDTVLVNHTTVSRDGGGLREKITDQSERGFDGKQLLEGADE